MGQHVASSFPSRNFYRQSTANTHTPRTNRHVSSGPARHQSRLLEKPPPLPLRAARCIVAIPPCHPILVGAVPPRPIIPPHPTPCPSSLLRLSRTVATSLRIHPLRKAHSTVPLALCICLADKGWEGGADSDGGGGRGEAGAG
jgi:hypothetical protein